MPVKKLAHTIQTSGKKYDVVLAITNGGIIPVKLMARELDINHIQFILIRNKRLHIEEMVPLLKGRKYLIVDDIYDTGDTFTKVFNIVKKCQISYKDIKPREMRYISLGD